MFKGKRGGGGGGGRGEGGEGRGGERRRGGEEGRKGGGRGGGGGGGGFISAWIAGPHDTTVIRLAEGKQNKWTIPLSLRVSLNPFAIRNWRILCRRDYIGVQEKRNRQKELKSCQNNSSHIAGNEATADVTQQANKARAT